MARVRAAPERRSPEGVATVADLSGSLREPTVSSLQVVANLLGNASFDAILPGFRNEAARKPEKPATPERR